VKAGTKQRAFNGLITKKGPTSKGTLTRRKINFALSTLSLTVKITVKRTDRQYKTAIAPRTVVGAAPPSKKDSLLRKRCRKIIITRVTIFA
jgi:hypothetical protein